MPSARSLLADRVMALVTPEWQDVEDLMERAIPLVPPGKAVREYDSGQRRNDAARDRRIAEGKPTGPRRAVPPDQEKQRQGARQIINAIIGHYRDVKVLEVEVGATRYDRRVRLSNERQHANHCCLHGGSCRGTGEPEADSDPPDAADPLDALIRRVLESRRQRMLPAPVVREVEPGSIDRLLRQCG